MAFPACRRRRPNRAYDDDQHLLDARAEAWREPTPELFRFVCACDDVHATPEKQP